MLLLSYLANMLAQLNIAFCVVMDEEMLFMDNAELYRHCIYFTIT